MQMSRRRMLAAPAFALLTACGGGAGAPGDDRAAALAARLDALEKRVAAAEAAGEPVGRLRDDAASLDRRVSSLETSVRELAARPAAPAASAPPATTPPAGAARNTFGLGQWDDAAARVDRTQRRAELRALSDEFRGRLAELRAQPGGMKDADQTRQILEWYREQRRAIMRGEGRTDR